MKPPKGLFTSRFLPPPGVGEEDDFDQEFGVSSPAIITISNLTDGPVTTRVVHDKRVHDNGNAINNKTIGSGEDGVFRIVAKTSHHGEINIDLVENSLPRKLLGRVIIRNMAAPESKVDGEPSTYAYAEAEGFFISAHGSSTPTQRRVNVLLVQNHQVKLQS